MTKRGARTNRTAVHPFRNKLLLGGCWKVRLIEEDFHRLMWEGAE